MEKPHTHIQSMKQKDNSDIPAAVLLKILLYWAGHFALLPPASNNEEWQSKT